MGTEPFSHASKPRKEKKSGSFLRIFWFCFLITTSLFSIFTIWFYLTPSGANVRNLLADTLITTQHRHWGKYLIGEEELKKRVEAYWNRFDDYAKEPVIEKPVLLQEKDKPPVEVEPVEGKEFKGYILYVHNPKQLRIVVPGKFGKGEKVSSMVQRTGAVAGVNGGAFNDPNWEGNGFQPSGIVMSGGKIFYLDVSKDTPLHVVGIDENGQMISGKYSANELLKLKVSEAVTFSPRFIVNGKGLIQSPADGWGIAPRTCMAQKADGTIMFAIIDGRQKHSIGATLYDVQNLFLERGAIIAANLDGGSSTVLVKDNTIINKPASEHGERYLPTAWLVFDVPDARTVSVKNIWEGVDINKIDPSKW